LRRIERQQRQNFHLFKRLVKGEDLGVLAHFKAQVSRFPFLFLKINKNHKVPDLNCKRIVQKCHSFEKNIKVANICSEEPD
jgi:hypothetical protein